MKSILLTFVFFLALSVHVTCQEKWTCYTDKSELLMDNQITLGVFDYIDGSLWIVTDRGINTFKDGKWKTISKKTDLIRNQIGSYLVDSQNRIWVGSGSPDMFFDGYAFRGLYEGGVVIYDGKEWKPRKTTDMGIKAAVVHKMFEQSNGDIWLGVSRSKPTERTSLIPKGALLRLSKKTGEWTVYKQEDMPCTDCQYVRGFYEDENGRLFFYARYGIYYFENDSFHLVKKTEEFSHKWPVHFRFEDSNKNLWLAAPPAHIYNYDGQKWRSFNRKNGLTIKNGYPYGFVETQDNKIIMTAANGLYTYNDKDQWLHEKMNYLYGNSFVDKQNRLWIAFHKGLIIRDGVSETMHKDITKVGQIFEDKNGGVWALSRNNGVWRLKDGEWQQFTKDNQLPSDLIKLYYVADNGTVWLATSKGICSCEYD